MHSVLMGFFAALTLFCFSTSSSAALISGTIEMDFFSGPLAGNFYSGSFTYDDTGLTGVGTEFALPDGATSNDRDLTLSVTVDGSSFDEMDDEDFPNAPELTIINGLPSFFDMWTDVAGTRNLVLFDDNEVQLLDTSAGNSVGDYVLELDSPAVPEPSTYALAALGLLGLGLYGRRRMRA